MNRRVLLILGLLVGDFVLFGGVYLGSYWLRFELSFLPERPVEPFDLYWRLAFLVAFLCTLFFYFSRLYDAQNRFGVDQIFSIVRALTMSYLSIMVMMYAFRGVISPNDTYLYSRLVVVISWSLSLFVLVLWRWTFYRLINMFRTKGLGLRRVLLVGVDDTTHHLYRAIREEPSWGYLPIGCLNNADKGTCSDGLKVLGTLYDLPEVLKTTAVDEVVLCITQLKSDFVAMLMNACKRADVRFSMVPSLFEIMTSHTQAQEIAGIPVFSIDEPLLNVWNRRLKRGIDVLISSFVVLLTLPLWSFVALAIKLESRGTVLFGQDRTGKGERHFHMLKFRSMHSDAENRQKDLGHLNEADGPIFKIRNDPRMTRVGKWIRAWSIDELPQLINVLKGDMSLVGPRPYPPRESDRLDTFQKRRYDVLPGITGLAQISGRSDLSIEETLRLDLYYIENWSVALDLKILLQTIPAVLTRRGAY